MTLTYDSRHLFISDVFRKLFDRKTQRSGSRHRSRTRRASRFLAHPFGSLDYVIQKSHRVHPDSKLRIRFDEVRTLTLANFCGRTEKDVAQTHGPKFSDR